MRPLLCPQQARRVPGPWRRGPGMRTRREPAPAARRRSSLLLTLAAILLFTPIEKVLSCPRDTTVAAEGAPGQPVSRIDALRGFLREGDFTRAEAEALVLLDAVEADSPDEALVLDILVEARWQAGRAAVPDTRQLAERAVATKLRQFGEDHDETVRSLRNLANVLEGVGEPDDAERTYRRLMAIDGRLHGPRSPQVANALVDLASLAMVTAHFDESRRLYEGALDIYVEAWGNDHARVGLVLNNLGNLLYRIGDYAGSERYYRRALATKERVLGKDHSDLGWTLNGLGIVLKELGDYDGARESYLRGLRIWEAAHGADHEYVSWIRNNLASLERVAGNYAESLALYDRTLETLLRQHGPRSLRVAKVNHNRARLLVDMGDFAEAERLYRQVLDVRVEQEGLRHPGVGRTLRTLADLRARMGRTALAEEDYRQALEIFEESVGRDHDDYAFSLAGLASARAERGDLADAERLYRDAREILEDVLGRAHPRVAETVMALGDLRSRVGDPLGAEALYTEALELREASLGPEHPLSGRSREALALAVARRGDLERALDLALGAERVGRQHLQLTIRVLPERQALRYADVRSSGLDIALSIATAPRGAPPDAIRRSWEAWIASRALVLDEMAMRRQGLASVPSGERKAALDALAEASRRLANLTFRGPSDENPERYRELLDGARREKESAERELARVSDTARRQRRAESHPLAALKDALDPGQAMVAFVKFRRHQLGRDAVAGAAPASSARYAAFIQRAGPEEPGLILLAAAEDVEERIAAWQRTARRPYHRLAGEAEARYRRAGRRLREAVWDPVAPELGGATLVFVVPAASLHLVSLATLPSEDGQYLVETGPSLHYLSAERDRTAPLAPVATDRGLLAVGGPAFDGPGTGGAPERDGGHVPSRRKARTSCEALFEVGFGALPSAASETGEIVSLWNATHRDGQAASEVVHLQGAAATEAAFKEQAPGRRVLHLSTHGFFLGGECPPPDDRTRGIGSLSGPSPDGGPGATPFIGESPLLLSGLALTGANRRDDGSPLHEDGILTAEEIAAMDLDGVEWAVLSACDTGVGELESGEGVLGLRRAFAIAGAATVVMSLWPVDDEETREWMLELYRARLEEGMTTAEAVREASLTMLHHARADHGSGHPFYWGAFVAAGRWE